MRNLWYALPFGLVVLVFSIAGILAGEPWYFGAMVIAVSFALVAGIVAFIAGFLWLVEFADRKARK